MDKIWIFLLLGFFARAPVDMNKKWILLLESDKTRVLLQICLTLM